MMLTLIAAVTYKDLLPKEKEAGVDKSAPATAPSALPAKAEPAK
jgi:hypothetical protein